MIEKKQKLIRQEDLEQCREAIRRDNRSLFRVFAVSGCVLSLANLVTQMVVTGYGMPLFRSSLMLVFFSLLFFLDRVAIPDGTPLSTWVIYAAQAPILLLSILLGTIWDRTHQATTFLLFMLICPLFITDHPVRSVGIMAGWSCLFVVLDQTVKDPSIRNTDMIHIMEFLAASAATTHVVVHGRMASMKRMDSLKYETDHDRDTGCLNRYAFEERSSRYVGKGISVILNDIDQLMLYSDFYGKDVGDGIMRAFTNTLMKHYGAENTYRYGADEILCLIPGTDREACERLSAACRKDMHAFSNDGYSIAVTFSQGCVSGTAETAEELKDMIQLAQIYTHKAGAVGRDQTRYGAFSQEALEEASAEANISSSHVRAYETNPLSGLPGMSYFCMRVDELTATLVDHESLPVVGYFKLTMLKEYNDEFGYQKGDQLIAETGKTLQQAFPYRLLGHITAGQFCIFCYLKEAKEGIEKALEVLRKAHPEFRIRGCAGFAEHTGSESASELIDLARIAQRSILNRPDQACCMYNLDLDEEIRFEKYIENHLDEAIGKEWIQVYYQPIARAGTGHICFEEALSRWADPQRGFLMPGRFIPVLEEKGLMYKLNLYVVERVLKDCRRRTEIGVPVVPVSVNLCRKDFLQCDMVQEISERVAASGYGPDILRIEITESAFIDNTELLGREVRRFREKGFRVWMDDFGSEYSTLNLLQEIDFDLIKIDMKFLNNLKPGEKNYLILTNIIRMIRELGIATLTEGVETADQNQTLRDLRCDLMQGFYFNKPNPFDYIAERALNGTGLVFEKYSPGGGGNE